MNTRLTATAALLAALFVAPAAMAQEATPDGFKSFTGSSLTREAVRADATAALKAGLIETGEASVATATFQPTRARAQVAAEGREAMRLGAVAFGEGPGVIVTPAQAESIRLAGLQAIGQTVASASR